MGITGENGVGIARCLKCVARLEVRGENNKEKKWEWKINKGWIYYPAHLSRSILSPLRRRFIIGGDVTRSRIQADAFVDPPPRAEPAPCMSNQSQPFRASTPHARDGRDAQMMTNGRPARPIRHNYRPAASQKALVPNDWRITP